MKTDWENFGKAVWRVVENEAGEHILEVRLGGRRLEDWPISKALCCVLLENEAAFKETCRELVRQMVYPDASK